MLNSIKKMIKLIMMSTLITGGFLIVGVLLVEVIGRATGLLSPKPTMMRISETKGYELDPTKPHISSQGLRDREFLLPKPPNTLRILTLGDSFTYGHGIASHETYVKQLETLLNTQHGGKNSGYEVLNAGVPGYNTRQEFLHLQDVGLRLDPDIILIGYNMNDADLSYMGMRNRGGNDWLVKVKKWMKENMALYSVVRVRAKRLSHLIRSARSRLSGGAPPLPGLQQAAAGHASPGWDLSRQSLANIATLAQERDLPVILAIYPNLLDLNDAYVFKEAHALVAQTATEYGMIVLDLFPEFKGQEASKLWIHPKDSHPNALANKIAAQGIYKGLVDHKFIDQIKPESVELTSS